MILVTGATGFIGRELITQLVNKVDKSKILCLVYNKAENDLEISGREVLNRLGVKYIPVDLVTGEGLDKVPKSPDMVFHMASVTITAQRDHSINDVGTRNLINAIQPVRPDMHFIFTSTICVTDKRENYSEPITEKLVPPVRPCNEYGRKKLLAENYLRNAATEMNFSLSIIRVTGVYGNGARMNGLFDSVEKLAAKNSVLVRINWPGKISIIHVSNMAELIIAVSQKPPARKQYEVYISSVEEYTMAEMTSIICKVRNYKYKPIKLPVFFWDICRFFARQKGIIEYILPHRIYDRFWQACILVNNEFWNRSEKIKSVIPDWKPMKYEEFYLVKKNNNV